MAYTIYLGKFAKRANSTATPDYSSWLSLEAVWKVPKDLDRPAFHVRLTGDTWPDYNYMYIPVTNAFYWITGIQTLGNDRFLISAAMDPLATNRDAIMNTSAFIEYGFNQDASGSTFRLQDTRQNVSNVPQVSTSGYNLLAGIINISKGCYCLTAVGASGGVAAYIISASAMQDLLENVAHDINIQLEGLTGVEDILRYFSYNSLLQGSAISAIRSCIWLPTESDIYTGTLSAIYLGDFNTGVIAKKISQNLIVYRTGSVDIPWPADDWKRINCQIQLYVPFIGTLEIPISQCNNESQIDVLFCLEPIGGTVSVRVDCGNYTVYIGSASIGSTYAIGSSNIPVQSFVSGMAQTLGGAIQVGTGIYSAGTTAVNIMDDLLNPDSTSNAGSTIAAGIQNVASGVVQAITPIVQCAGTMSGAAACGQSMGLALSLFYYPPIDDAGFQALYGHPVMRVAKPVSGYCKTRGFSLAINIRASEITAVNALMDSGVFIE